MPTIEITRLARDELRGLIKTRQLPPDTRVVVAFHDARNSDAAIARA
ncbi:MAG TPA: hypothetical protein VFX45_02450 [Solirubrobacterales bacterium]|nr:hypothetical protein [Solirubrobacterales bacterium]